MIARPVHRPAPIPFDAPSPKPGASQPRAISWAAASGPAEHPPLEAQPRPFAAPRLSPVKVAMPPAPLPAGTFKPVPRPATSATMSAVPPAPRPTPIKTPYDRSPDKGLALTELSARYIGQGNLSVRSSVTGRHYRFQGHGDSQKIDKHDLMLLKRIPDLVIR